MKDMNGTEVSMAYTRRSSRAYISNVAGEMPVIRDLLWEREGGEPCWLAHVNSECIGTKIRKEPSFNENELGFVNLFLFILISLRKLLQRQERSERERRSGYFLERFSIILPQQKIILFLWPKDKWLKSYYKYYYTVLRFSLARRIILCVHYCIGWRVLWRFAKWRGE